MAKHTRSGLLLPAIIVVALRAEYGVSKVLDFVQDITGASDAVVIGEGDAAIMVAADAESTVKSCQATIIQDKRCGDLHVLFVDAARMPFIARNTKLAW